MKKGLILLTVVALLLTFGLTAVAAPNGITTTAVMDFTSFADGETTLSALGFWTGGGDSTATVADGKISIDTAVWGAFPNLTEDQIAAYAGKSGVAFYFAASDVDAVIGFGFNDNTNANHVLSVDRDVILETADGTVTVVKTELHSGFGQGVFTVPAEFEGYVYIPFTTFAQNGLLDTVFDYENKQPATFIYAIGDGVPVTYGEFYAYSGTYTPDNSGEPSDTADVSTIAYAVAAIAGLGSLTVLRKKK